MHALSQFSHYPATSFGSCTANTSENIHTVQWKYLARLCSPSSMMLQGSGPGQEVRKTPRDAGLRLQREESLRPLLPRGSESPPMPASSQLPQALLIFIPGVVFSAERILFPRPHPPGGWMIKIAIFTSCSQQKGKGQGCDMGPAGSLGTLEGETF